MLCGDEEQAKDIRQEVFIKVWQRIDHLVKVDNVAGYLFVMTRNTFIDDFRERKCQRKRKERLLSQCNASHCQAVYFEAPTTQFDGTQYRMTKEVLYVFLIKSTEGRLVGRSEHFANPERRDAAFATIRDFAADAKIYDIS